jgi:hypothetical protein
MRIEVLETYKELEKKDEVKIARSKTAYSLDEETKNNPDLTIEVSNFVTMHIENPEAEKEDDKDFNRYCIVATNGDLYITRSEAFAQELNLIISMMETVEITVRPVHIQSTKTGNRYLSCEIV